MGTGCGSLTQNKSNEIDMLQTCSYMICFNIDLDFPTFFNVK